MTPVDIVERSRAVLGSIDLDPASSVQANERVKAKLFFTRENDALNRSWGVTPRSVFLNPPGGKVGNQSKTVLFWKKLMECREQGGLEHAVFLAFSAEALQTTQGKGCKSVGEFMFCVPSTRVRFDAPDGSKKNAPSHSNVIAYVPGTVDRSEEFKRQFRSLGVIVHEKMKLT